MLAAELDLLEGQLHLLLPVVHQRHHSEGALADRPQELEAAGQVALELLRRLRKWVVLALILRVGLRHDCIIS